jgi:predicted N-acetyltransferase YhbS
MSIVVRPMLPADYDAAQDAHRLAFAKFFGLDPKTFRPGNRVLATRTTTYPEGGLVAEEGGRIVGSAVIMFWGTAAIVGPITVHPDKWSSGIGRALMGAIVEKISALPHAALYTHPQSPAHLRLYESFGFQVGSLIAVMDGKIGKPAPARTPSVEECRAVAGANFDGLDLTREIEGLNAQKLGSVIGVDGGFAVCHFGPGSEAREDKLYVKFAAVRPNDEKAFAALLDAIEGEAARVGVKGVALGVNSARRAAYRALLARGYRVEMWGIAMRRPDGPGWDRPDCFVIDDLR